jgi:hypothetical protein
VVDADRPPAEVFLGVKEALERVLKDREDDGAGSLDGSVGPAG